MTTLDGVDLDIGLGRMHILAGGNGAGKSPLIRFLAGSDRASRGSILIDGRHPVEHPQMVRKIAYVPQELSLFPDVSVAENLFMPSDRTGHGGLVNRRRMEAQADISGAFRDRGAPFGPGAAHLGP